MRCKPPSPLLGRLSLLVGYVACILVMSAHEPEPRWELYLAPALVAIAGGCALRYRGSYRSRAALYVAVIVGAVVAADLATRRPEMRILYCFAVLLAGTLLHVHLAVVVAGLATGIILMRPLNDAAGPGLHIALIWASVGLTWSIVGRIALLLARSEADEQRAWQSAREARRSRGELRSVVRSLEEAMYRIERMNSELLVARRDAEVARPTKRALRPW